MPQYPPPHDIAELERRATLLAGRTLAQLAQLAQWPVPEDLRRQKGWPGQLIEHLLGATAGSRAEPDFPHLGVELKTLPLNPRGKVMETTYVCTAPLDGSMAQTWETSWVRKKLSCVLWVPIVVPEDRSVANRRVARPFLWRPNEAESRVLKADWELLTDFIALGEVDQLHARHGAALQLRPKAASSRDRTWILNEEGEWSHANPKGFYLRTGFTSELLRRHLRMPS